MCGGDRPATRPGWVRDVAVPRTLDELCGALTGTIGLPAGLFWSGAQPQAVRWDLTDPGRRRDLYEIVLVKGALDDVRQFVNGPALVEIWDQLYLPPWVRAARRPLIDSAKAAA